MDNLSETLFNISLKTFEELAFLMLMPEENQDVVNESTVMTSVEYTGYSTGALYIQVNSGLLPVLAQNILAEDNISQEQQQDALKEIANVICGNLLPSLAGADKKHRLNAPTIVNEFNSQYQTPDYDTANAVFHFMEGTAKLYWHYDKTKL